MKEIEYGFWNISGKPKKPSGYGKPIYRDLESYDEHFGWKTLREISDISGSTDLEGIYSDGTFRYDSLSFSLGAKEMVRMVEPEIKESLDALREDYVKVYKKQKYAKRNFKKTMIITAIISALLFFGLLITYSVSNPHQTLSMEWSFGIIILGFLPCATLYVIKKFIPSLKPNSIIRKAQKILLINKKSPDIYKEGKEIRFKLFPDSAIKVLNGKIFCVPDGVTLVDASDLPVATKAKKANEVRKFKFIYLPNSVTKLTGAFNSEKSLWPEVIIICENPKISISPSIQTEGYYKIAVGTNEGNLINQFKSLKRDF